MNKPVLSVVQPVVPLSGVVSRRGEDVMFAADGRPVPVDMVAPVDRDEDETTRRIAAAARALSEALATFKREAFAGVDGLLDRMAKTYGAKIRSKKGNHTIDSYDGRFRVEVQVAEQIDFGIQLEAAKSLIDQCIATWAEGSRDEIRALVDVALGFGKKGKIDRAALLKLRKMNAKDPRWRSAMKAIADAQKVVGSKRYVRVYIDDVPVKLDLASV